MIRQRFPELVRFLPPRRLESLASPDPHVQLLAALQHRDLPVFRALLHHDAVDPNNWYDDPYYCTCLELACRQHRSENFVAALVEAGADPNTSNRIYGIPVVHQATENANHQALAVLIRQGRARLDVTDRSKHTALHEELENIERCISLLLEHEEAAAETLPRANWYDAVDATLRPRIDIDAQDEFGDTALHDAAHYGNQQVVLALLRRGANIMKKNQDGDPPLAFIDAKTIDQFLDEQIKSNGLSPLSQDYQVIIRYTFLEPSTEKATGRSEMDALHYISRSRDLRPLLRHPVINSFLNLKWYMVRWFFYINLIVYTLFVTLITAYILLINVDDEDITNCTMINIARKESSAKIMDVVDPEKSSLVLNLECKEFDENCTQNHVRQLSLSDVDKLQVASLVKAVFGNKKRCVHQHDDPKHLSAEEFAAHCLRIPCIYLLIGLVLREIVQCATGWKRYAKDWENVIEFLMIIVCAIALSSDWDASNFKQHISAMAILLTWTELVFMTGRLPYLSVQLEMLKKVSFTFLRFMAWYSLLVVAFALSFYTLFRRSKEYDPESKEAFFLDPGLSVIKTIIMMVGEFEASELVFDSVPGTSHVVFIIFVFLIAIILLNLLNGLAVYDTQAIKEDAVVLGLVSMVKLVAYLEMMLIKIAVATQCMYKGLYREVLEPRIRLFRTDLSKKQIHAFPNSGEIKFLLDAATTARFKGFRMERDIMVKATDIVTEKKQVSDIEQVKRRLNKFQIKFEEIESKQSKTHELLIEALESLSKFQKTVRESTI
ncbi:Transient receptor potential cation channel protein painless [Gryllus bimaculatus]|nr:Transient receptor potential cation channel protein painless [Gryllus bimaculatus]